MISPVKYSDDAQRRREQIDEVSRPEFFQEPGCQVALEGIEHSPQDGCTEKKADCSRPQVVVPGEINREKPPDDYVLHRPVHHLGDTIPIVPGFTGVSQDDGRDPMQLHLTASSLRGGKPP